MVTLLERLNLLAAGWLPPEGAWETELRSIRHALRELGAHVLVGVGEGGHRRTRGSGALPMGWSTGAAQAEALAEA